MIVMKNVFWWVALVVGLGWLAAWVCISRSDGCHAAAEWVSTNRDILSDVGTIEHVYPDPRRYRVWSSGDLSAAHFVLFVVGSKQTDHVDFQLQGTKGKWTVVEAMNGDKSWTISGGH